jgi:MFS family permease
MLFGNTKVQWEWDRNIQLFLLYTFLSTAFRGIWDQHIMSVFIYLITNGSNSSVGLLTGISGIAQLICTFFTATIGDTLSRSVILICGACLGLVSILMSVTAISLANYFFLLVCMVLWGFYWAMTNPTLDAMVADSVQQGERSKIYSTVATFRFVGRAFGPLVSIILFLSIGDNWTIHECQSVMTIGLVLFLLPTILLAMFRPPATAPSLFSVSPLESVEPKTDVKLTDSSDQLSIPQPAPSGLPSPSPRISPFPDSSSIYFSYCPSLLYVPSMIAFADIISGLASGMTIKFFPIFFANDLHLSPIGVSAVIMVLPLPPLSSLLRFSPPTDLS